MTEEMRKHRGSNKLASVYSSPEGILETDAKDFRTFTEELAELADLNKPKVKELLENPLFIKLFEELYKTYITDLKGLKYVGTTPEHTQYVRGMLKIKDFFFSFVNSCKKVV